MSIIEVNYKASPTMARFHASNAFNRIVRGPVGSGKSSGCCFELFRRACEQAAFLDPDTKRPTRFSRFVVVRNSCPQLRDTTIKTWLDWIPENLGHSKFNHQEMTHTLHFNDVFCEVLFRSLDRPEDVNKLLSLEVTGAWFNECREMPKAIFDAMSDRVGRYPSQRMGGCTWRGIIGDTNPPDDDHWLYNLAEKERPEGWEFFVQPGGLIERNGEFFENPEAENIDHLEPGYYTTRQAGKSKEHIKVYYCNEYGFVRDGKPVIHEYVDAVHCSQQVLEPDLNQTLFIGLDFGLTPAAAFMQRDTMGRIYIIDEMATEDMGAQTFGELLKSKIQREYMDFLIKGQKIVICGDPAGEQRSQADEKTPYQILNKILKDIGLSASKAHTNDFTVRREAFAAPLTRLIDGKPGLLVSPKAAVIRKGLSGGYCYKRLKVSGDERYRNEPDKTKWSHAVEAAGYALLAMGEGKAVLGTSDVKREPVSSRRGSPTREY